MNILAIAAHPDDPDLWCGGTLVKYAKAGHCVSVCILTNGRTGSFERVDDTELVAARQLEQTAAAKHYGATVNFLDYGDGELFHDNHTLLRVIAAIREAEPDIMFTHHPRDMNTDHLSAGELVTRSLMYLNLPNVRVDAPPMRKPPQVFYWDTYGGIDFQPVAYVDITDEMETKRAAVACHKTQMTGIGWDDMMEVMARFRGLQSGCRYAEGFAGYQTFAAMPDYRLLP